MRGFIGIRNENQLEGFMRAISWVIALVPWLWGLPAQAQSSASFAVCLTGQVLCNKACGKGPTAMSCINNCTTKAQACASNGGRSDLAAEEDEEPAPKPRRRARPAVEEEDEPAPPPRRRVREPDEQESESPSKPSSRKSSRSDGKCTPDAEFVHSWPVDKDNDKFKFKFRVSSDDCNEYSCRGYIHYRIHFNWRSGGNNTKTTLVRYTIRKGQRATEVTDELFPSGANMALNVRDVEINEVSCSSP
jgi:hypothetical protein